MSTPKDRPGTSEGEAEMPGRPSSPHKRGGAAGPSALPCCSAGGPVNLLQRSAVAIISRGHRIGRRWLCAYCWYDLLTTKRRGIEREGQE